MRNDLFSQVQKKALLSALSAAKAGSHAIVTQLVLGLELCEQVIFSLANNIQEIAGASS